jgi:hypothetical protein
MKKAVLFFLISGMFFYLTSNLIVPLIEFDLFKSSLMHQSPKIKLNHDKVAYFLFIIVFMPLIVMTIFYSISIFFFRKKVWVGILVCIGIFMLNYIFTWIGINSYIISKIVLTSNSTFTVFITLLICLFFGVFFILKGIKNIQKR